MQDTARSLAYGVGQVRCLLEGQAGGETFLQDYLDRSEHAFVGVAGATELFEPLVVLAGGGTGREQAAEGAKKVHQTFATAVDLYLERLAGAGLERRGRSRLPVFFSAP